MNIQSLVTDEERALLLLPGATRKTEKGIVRRRLWAQGYGLCGSCVRARKPAVHPTSRMVTPTARLGFSSKCTSCESEQDRARRAAAAAARPPRPVTVPRCMEAACSVRLVVGVNWKPSSAEKHHYLCAPCTAHRARQRKAVARAGVVSDINAGGATLTPAEEAIMVVPRGARRIEVHAIRTRLETHGVFYCRACARAGRTHIHPVSLGSSKHRTNGFYVQCAPCTRALQRTIDHRGHRVRHRQAAWVATKADPEIHAHIKQVNRKATAAYRKRWRATRVQATSLLSSARHRARRAGVPMTLTRAWVEERLEAGVCEVTGVRLLIGTPDGLSPWSPSIDRQEPALGYTAENARLVAWGLNMLKQTDSDYGSALDFAREIAAANVTVFLPA